jgi:hypothetical protein
MLSESRKMPASMRDPPSERDWAEEKLARSTRITERINRVRLRIESPYRDGFDEDPTGAGCGLT